MPHRTFRLIKRPIFNSALVIGTCFLILLTARGILFSFPILYVALLDDYGWSRETTSSIFSINLFLSLGVGQFLVGLLLRSVRVKRVLVLSSLILSLSLLMISTAKTLWDFYLYIGFLSAFGFAGLGWIPVVKILSDWFHTRRGFIISLAFSGIGLGALIFGPLTQYLISTVGWRSSYVYFGLIVAGILLPSILVQPSAGGESRKSEEAYPSQGEENNPQYRVGATLGGALHTRAFWYLFLVYLFSSLAIFSVYIHQIAYLVDTGFEKMYAASLFGIQGVLSTVGRLFFAYLSDISGRANVLVVSMTFTMVGVGFLALASFIRTDWVIYFFTFFYGISLGASSPILSALTADLYQGPNFGGIYGLLLVSNGISGAVGPWAAGYLFDRTGSYMLTFLLAICFLGVACFIMVRMKRELLNFGVVP